MPRIHIYARSPRLRAAGRLLVTCLRRPNLHILEEGEMSVDGPVIDLDPGTSDLPIDVDPRSVFRLDQAERTTDPIDCRVTAEIGTRLPQRLESIFEDNGYLADFSLANRARSTLSLAWRRFRKATQDDPSTDLIESAVCAEMYGTLFGEAARHEFESWLRYDEDAAILKNPGFRREPTGTPLDDLERLIRGCLGSDDEANYFRRLTAATAEEPPLDENVMARIMTRPAVVVHASLLLAESGSEAAIVRLTEGLRMWLPKCATAKQLCAIGSSALLLHQADVLHRVLDVMKSPPWRVEDSVLLPLVPRGRNIERSLLAAGFLVAIAMRVKGATFSAFSLTRIHADLEWRGFGSQTIDTSIEKASLRFFDPETRRISDSLLENWLRMLEQPHLDQGQLCISESRYDQAVEAVESIWGRIVDAIALDAGQPVIRTRPWPAGASFAVSVRYDVDRPVAEGTVDRVLDIQAQSLGGMCGSWFFIEGAAHNGPVRDDIQGRGQEIGVHTTRMSRESCRGFGVTAHSAQHSEYFRGRRSLLDAEEGGVLYTEQMTHLAPSPRPAWLGDRAADIWAFPLHFPVEGGIRDRDLTYFERNAEACIAQRRVGAHIILGAHPDCDPELIRLAAGRCALGGGWPATLKDVLERTQALFSPGNIRVEIDGDRIAVWSRLDVDDVVFEYLPPGGKPMLLGTDLRAGEVGLLRLVD